MINSSSNSLRAQNPRRTWFQSAQCSSCETIIQMTTTMGPSKGEHVKTSPSSSIHANSGEYLHLTSGSYRQKLHPKLAIQPGQEERVQMFLCNEQNKQHRRQTKFRCRRVTKFKQIKHFSEKKLTKFARAFLVGKANKN